MRATLLTLALILLPSIAAADETPYRFGTQTESYALVGLTAGGSFGTLGGGGFVGGELSYARQRKLLWYGVYVDGAYDFGHSAAMFTAGPEFGWGPLGIDGGPALRLGVEDEAELGLQVRGMLTFGMFGFYFRHSRWPQSTFERVSQVGVLLKLPFWNTTPIPPDAR